MKFQIGDRVRLQDAKAKTWHLKGTIHEQREADDGKILSYLIQTDEGYSTLHHRIFLKLLNTQTEAIAPLDGIDDTSKEIPPDVCTSKITMN